MGEVITEGSVKKTEPGMSEDEIYQAASHYWMTTLGMHEPKRCTDAWGWFLKGWRGSATKESPPMAPNVAELSDKVQDLLCETCSGHGSNLEPYGCFDHEWHHVSCKVCDGTGLASRESPRAPVGDGCREIKSSYIVDEERMLVWRIDEKNDPKKFLGPTMIEVVDIETVKRHLALKVTTEGVTGPNAVSQVNWEKAFQAQVVASAKLEKRIKELEDALTEIVRIARSKTTAAAPILGVSAIEVRAKAALEAKGDDHAK